MKLDSESADPNGESPQNGPGVRRDASKRFRLLKWNELVRQGDFVADLLGAFQLWEGPTGFRADAFVKPIYRQDKSRPSAGRKTA